MIPLIINDVAVGVLDIDAPTCARFQPEDVQLFTRALDDLRSSLETVNWSALF